MTEEYLYHFKKTRKQRSKLFIRMGVVSLGYIAVLYLVEHYYDFVIPKDVHNIILIAFSLTSIILFYFAWWLIKNPATYEAYITSKEFSVSYSEVQSWSFKVKIEDIERIEQRQNHSSGGKSILNVGVVMKNAEFHEISMNYGNSVNKIFKVLRQLAINNPPVLLVFLPVFCVATSVT